MAPKYDFYQTEQKVVVDILLKNAKDKNYQLTIDEQDVHLTADDGIDLTIRLFKPINKATSTHKASPSKIEVILMKLIGEQWPQLEREKDVKPVTTPARKQPKDWDKLAKEVEKTEEEERQGEAALNALFQKIYADSNEETRRAMNKSFMESGGTVLSTNWKEVGEKPVEVKPPDGCEYKTFDK
ncbi:protein SGT1 homolog [Culicoides brevitarsis]|uniref:protein SGT1 homolog n=1 Tax=Culicoides brevitarsis TaxID=469753 RepID=UPI00307BC505